MQRYNPSEIEPKWQQKWQESGIYKATEDPAKPKRYVLEYFPYPSGAAMHVGHVRNYTIGDVVARFYRMRGYNVMHPMGWDAFGLPAENYAIKHGISPQQAIAENTSKFKQQLTQMGFSYDWSREINSSDPSYYKWTQWFFKMLYERNLAYQKESLQWWCETDKTVLANEQVEAGRCWRCGNEVTKKPLKQWFFKITDYADRLSEDLDNLDWSDSIKSMQRNWIGKSKGAEIDFSVDGHDEKIRVFTTRPDTLFGATFMVLAPEHPLVAKVVADDRREEVEAYISKTRTKTDVERMETDREKTGVFTGSYGINPANGEKIPVWIADYVLYGYGTGAIMAVPAHDERDHAFAEKFGLEIIEVIEKPTDAEEGCYHGEGTIKNSGKYDGMNSDALRDLLPQEIEGAEEKINYRIRDWLISRQRYWGAPIPIIHCDKDGAVPVPDEQLPVELPEVESYQPTGEGTSVLAGVETWVNTQCPKCGGPAKRETDTMDGFACSSWYFLRYADPNNSEAAFDPAKAKFWLPVDDYIGGAEHAVMHLLYARMWTKVMYDAGLIEFDEPFKALRNQGMILAPDGRKMSKSWGNVIAPDDLISQGYGADTVRIMELFIGPWDQEAAWSIESVGGCYRFLQRVWTLNQEFLNADKKDGDSDSTKQLNALTHRTIKKVTDDLHEMGFNTAIAALMEYTNGLYKLKTSGFAPEKEWRQALVTLAQLIAPFAPHIAEELWKLHGMKGSVHMSPWPKWDEKYLVKDTVNLVVQVNGKLRATLQVPAGISKEDAENKALENERVLQFIGDKKPAKVVYVPGRLVNIVIS